MMRTRRGQEGGGELATVSKLSIIQPPSTMDCTHHTPGVVAREDSRQIWRA